MTHAMTLLSKLRLFRPNEDPVLEARFARLNASSKHERRAHGRTVSVFATPQKME